jgi:hypothetical protein
MMPVVKGRREGGKREERYIYYTIKEYGLRKVSLNRPNPTPDPERETKL